MRTRVFLTPSNTSLVGAFPGEAEHVHIICDTSSAAFTVTLPDLFHPAQREFIFYNMPENGIGNPLTVVPVSGQVIRLGEQLHILSPLDTAGFVSDMRSRWLLNDTNH